MAEPRAPVMILVEVFWQDHSEIWHTAPARIEDKSSGGVCIRVKAPFSPGAKVKIQWRLDQFLGTVKYCRSEGREYLVGIPRATAQGALLDVASSAVTARQALINASFREPTFTNSTFNSPDLPGIHPPRIEPQISNLRVERPIQQESGTDEIRRAQPSGMPMVRFVRSPIPAPARRSDDQRNSRHRPRLVQRVAEGCDASKKTKPRANKRTQGKQVRRERKSMARKWLELALWHNKSDEPRQTQEAATDRIRHADGEKENRMPNVTQPSEKLPAHSAREVQNFQVELLPPQDIYNAAGIANSQKGYSVLKVVEMLNSEHIRDLSKEMKRAAVLMALDAAGVSIEQVRQDAKARQQALDSYETEQEKQAEAEWARKAEEITQIQSELESIKAHYMARINRNLEGVAREKARFNNWVEAKQQETKSMAEAVELCLKSPVAETAGAQTQTASVAANAASTSAPKPA